MKTRSKLLSIALSLVLAIGLCPASAFAADLTAAGANLTVQAVSHIRDEAVAEVLSWRSAAGFNYDRSTSDVKKQPGVDCVDVAKRYYDYLGIGARRGDAWTYADAGGDKCPAPCIRVYSNPQPGDIAAWGKSNARPWGHVAVVVAVSGSQIEVVEQSTGSGKGCYSVKYDMSSPTSYIRPEWPNPDPDPGDRVRISAGKYIIQSKIGDRVIDIDAGSEANNANAQLWEPLGSSGQTFNVGHNDDLDAEYFQPCCSYKFLDAEGGAVPTNVSQYDGTGGGNQNWVLKDAGDGYVYIRNLVYGYLDVSGGENRNGANVWVCGYNGSDAQKWKLIPVSGNSKQAIPSGTCILRSKVGNRLLDVAGGGKGNGANIQLWQPNGTTNQVFEINQSSASSACSIKIPASGKVLDTAGNANGPSNVQQWDSLGDWGQSWFFEDAGDGYVYICNKWGRYLDVSGGSNKNGANAWVCGYNGSDSQKWKVMRVSGKAKTVIPDGIYYMQSKIGNRSLDIEGASSSKGANARLWESNASQSQVFNVGWFGALEANYIQLKTSGLYLDTAGGDGRANLWQWDGNGGWGQNWFFEDAGDGWYYVRNLYGYYADVDAGTNANGTNVQAWSFVGSDGQKWRLVPQATTDNPSNPTDPTDPTEPKDPTNPTDPTELTDPTKPTTPTTPTQPTTPAIPTDPADPSSSTGQDPAAETGKDDKPQTGSKSTKATSVAGATVTGVKSKTYTGKALTQSPTVKVGGKTLKAGADYTLKYASNVKAGKATMTITGQGSYTGTKVVSFAIAKANVKNATAAKVKPQKYRKGKAIKPSPKITYKGKPLKKGTDYTLKYKSNKKRGTATITVKGKGNFQGSKAVKFKIR